MADLGQDLPGIALARARGVPTLWRLHELARLGGAIDILIDVTGVAKVRESLREHFQQSGNHHTIIMHELIAVLMKSLSKNELVSSKHKQLDYG